MLSDIIIAPYIIVLSYYMAEKGALYINGDTICKKSAPEGTPFLL